MPKMCLLAFFLKKNIKMFVVSKIQAKFAPAKANRGLLPEIGVWCNGNTTDSGPVILGSSPSTPTSTSLSILIIRRKRCFFMLVSILSTAINILLTCKRPPLGHQKATYWCVKRHLLEAKSISLTSKK